MTVEERVSAVAEFGFTPRQARFLVLVISALTIAIVWLANRMEKTVRG